MKKRVIKGIGLIVIIIPLVWFGKLLYKNELNPNPFIGIGDAIDSLDGVEVYYNGMVDHTGGRNLSPENYNLGLKYQCVEFVKRYYFEHFGHQMPDSYGHAKDFFDPSVNDGTINRKRNLLQFRNPSGSMPRYGDILIFDGHAGNPFGHVAIVSKVDIGTVEIIQQNPGPFASSRAKFKLFSDDDGFQIADERLLGWLGKR